MINYKQTLEGRTKVEQSANVDELARAFGEEAERLGAPYFGIGRLVRESAGELSVEVVAERGPEPLSVAFIARAIPEFQTLKRGFTRREGPYDSVEGGWDADEPHLLLTYLRQHGVHGFISVPRFGIGGVLGYSIMFMTERVSAVNRAALCVLGWSGVKRGVDLARGADAEADSPLTRRQKQALAHCADGKSDWDIAQIMEIAPATVHEHIEAAKRRIGVRTRMQAVLQAAQAGWLVS